MKFLFFDTETTGLPRFKNAPVWCLFNWPRVIQLGWVLTDHNKRELESGCHLIRPRGFRIPEASMAFHGISNEMAAGEGSPLKPVLTEFAQALGQAEVVVAHNIQFDQMILRAEFLRAGMRNLFRGKKLCCTMRESTEFCALPRGTKLKWPSLLELHRVLFDREFEHHHNALADSRACLRCFWELKKLGILR